MNAENIVMISEKILEFAEFVLLVSTIRTSRFSDFTQRLEVLQKSIKNYLNPVKIN